MLSCPSRLTLKHPLDYSSPTACLHLVCARRLQIWTTTLLEVFLESTQGRTLAKFYPILESLAMLWTLPTLLLGLLVPRDGQREVLGLAHCGLKCPCGIFAIEPHSVRTTGWIRCTEDLASCENSLCISRICFFLICISPICMSPIGIFPSEIYAPNLTRPTI